MLLDACLDSQGCRCVATSCMLEECTPQGMHIDVDRREHVGENISGLSAQCCSRDERDFFLSMAPCFVSFIVVVDCYTLPLQELGWKDGPWQ